MKNEQLNQSEEVVEAEFTEVEEATSPEPVQEIPQPKPMKIRIHLIEGSPIEVTAHDIPQGNLKRWILSNTVDLHTGKQHHGLFIDNLYIPSQNIRFYEEVR